MICDSRCRCVSPIHLLHLLECKWVLIDRIDTGLLHVEDQIKDAEPFIHFALSPGTQSEIPIDELDLEFKRPSTAFLPERELFLDGALGKDFGTGQGNVIFVRDVHESFSVGEHRHREKILEKERSHLGRFLLLLDIELSSAEDNPEEPQVLLRHLQHALGLDRLEQVPFDKMGRIH